NALSQIDSLGFYLDELGIENNINRHNIIAALMFGQKRLEGEIDSLNARLEVGKAKVDSVVDSVEKSVGSATDVALFPAKYTYSRIKSIL
ncbi:MAG: hypothetical protein CUN55_16975, partial [Phototrophicales bacterium]